MSVGVLLSFRLSERYKDLAVRPVPGWNLMPPPKLARDAPGLNVAHPLEIGLLPILRYEGRAPVLHRGDRRFGQLRRVDVPLVRQPRLDYGVAALRMRHGVDRRFDLLHKTQCREILNDVLACDKAIKPAIFLRHVLGELRLGV